MDSFSRKYINYNNNYSIQQSMYFLNKMNVKKTQFVNEALLCRINITKQKIKKGNQRT